MIVTNPTCSVFRDVVIDIPNKVKGLRVDACYNVTVLLTSALSGLEVVNSKKMKLQVSVSIVFF